MVTAMGDVAPIPSSDGPAGLEQLPEVLTVEEAGQVLRISRGPAFQQTALYRETDGAEGIPNYRIGGCLRVPTAELLRRLGLEADR